MVFDFRNPVIYYVGHTQCKDITHMDSITTKLTATAL